jgi:spore germination protein
MMTQENGEEQIERKDLILAVSSMMVGVGILTLPRIIAETTETSGGWMSILLAGLAAMSLAWSLAKLASMFPKQSFYDYTSVIATKPVSVILTLLIGLYFILVAAYITRQLSNIIKQYLFDRTPIEVIALIFVLIVIYAVSGSRTALLRLNVMFFPIVLTVMLLVQFMNLGFIETDNFKPFFVTPWNDVLTGALKSEHGFLGFEIVLFYTALMKKPKDAPKAAMMGVALPMMLYLIIYIFVIGVFSNVETANQIYPTIELSKEVEVPGEFFERFESIFLTIWVMTIFNTAAMAYDVSVLSMGSVFKKIQKFKLTLVLAPVVYLIAMVQQDINKVSLFGTWTGYYGFIVAIGIPIFLLWFAKLRGVKGNG